MTKTSLRILSRFTLAIGGLIAGSAANAEEECARTSGSSWAESAICASSTLKRFDDRLNRAYALARQVRQDRDVLRADQRRWLRLVRDKCSTEECLYSVYEQRVLELTDEFLSLVQPSEQLSNDEARALCGSLATVADEQGLKELAIPGNEPWVYVPGKERAGWTLSSEDLARLAARELYWSKEIQTLYKLRPTPKSHPILFAAFSTGGTCASEQVFSIPQLLDPQVRDEGIDNVDDPDELIRWAYWGGGDYPIFYRGRYFMVVSAFTDRDRVNMISWIKPDGRIRPLCLLSAERANFEVISAKNPQLCAGIAAGSIRPLSWLPITKDLPLDRQSGRYWEEFVKRYGTYADQVELLSLDIDKDDQAENIGRFRYDSGAGCGSTHTRLSVLSKDLEHTAAGPLTEYLRQLGDGVKDVYELEQHYYVLLNQTEREARVVPIPGERNEQTCKLRQRFKTQVTRFFDIEP